MPITEKGYERPTYEDLLEAQIGRAKQLFGEDIDTNDNTPLGKYIRLNVVDLADVYEISEKIYFARFPHTATGVSLDRLCPFTGVTRNPATHAQHSIKFIGTAGENVPAGFEVSTADGSVIFHLYNSLPIGDDGTVVGVVECEQAGTIGNVAVGKIDTIVNPDTYVESIEHLDVEIYGKEIETDVDLRARFDLTVGGAGSATVASLRGAIARVPLVDGVAVIENDTDEVVDGIPPHSFECFVLSPETQDQQVAAAIFSKKPVGIKSHGGVSVEITDDSGVPHIISFSRTIQVDMRVRVTVTTNSYFEADGIDQIKSHIATYINNLKNGNTVYVSSIYGYIYKATGVVNVPSLELSTDGAVYSKADVAIAGNEVARVSVADIEVVVS